MQAPPSGARPSRTATRDLEGRNGGDINQTKYTTIAHSRHVFYNPMGPERADNLLGLLDLSPGDRVLDVGCGRAELLVRAIERYGIAGTGIDTNADFLDRARVAAEGRVPEGALTLLNLAAASFAPGDGAFAAAICTGSTHAYGGYAETLRALSRLVRSRGRILVGEGFWKREPDPEYLAALGAAPDELMSHEGNIVVGEGVGLRLMHVATSSLEEWDHFEGLYARTVEEYASAHPEDPDSGAMGERIARWRDAYVRWGRDTLGFGLYLFRR